MFCFTLSLLPDNLSLFLTLSLFHTSLPHTPSASWKGIHTLYIFSSYSSRCLVSDSASTHWSSSILFNAFVIHVLHFFLPFSLFQSWAPPLSLSSSSSSCLHCQAGWVFRLQTVGYALKGSPCHACRSIQCRKTIRPPNNIFILSTLEPWGFLAWVDVERHPSLFIEFICVKNLQNGH